MKTTAKPSRFVSRTQDAVLKSRHSVPFAKVKQNMGELSFSSNTESSEIWRIKHSEVFCVPIGMKCYDAVNLNPIMTNIRYKEDKNKDKYLKALTANANVFRRKSGDFTNYANFSILRNKIGPFNRKNN